jgi:hypothetical protein
MREIIDLDKVADASPPRPRRRRTGLIAGAVVVAAAVVGLVGFGRIPARDEPVPAAAPSVRVAPDVLKRYVAAADAAAKRDAGRNVVVGHDARPLVGYNVDDDEQPRMLMDADDAVLDPGTYTLTAFCAGTGKADFSIRLGVRVDTYRVTCTDPVRPVRQAVTTPGGRTDVSVVAVDTSVVGAAYRLERS